MKSDHWRLGSKNVTFSRLGFGGVPLGNLYRSISDKDADALLECAWEGGVRYYDTAPLYGLGLSETRLNRLFRGKRRDEFLLSTKVGRLLKPCAPAAREGIGQWFDVPNRQQVYNYTYDGIMRSVEFSLERLGLERIDILYVHDLDIYTHKTREKLDFYLEQFTQGGGFKAMKEMRSQKMVKAIGAGINQSDIALQMAKHFDFDLFLLAGRYTLLDQSALNEFFPYCLEHEIDVVIGGPYNSGILATGAVSGAHYDYAPASVSMLKKVGDIENICQAFGIRLIDAAFNFPLLHPAVLSVIPGAQNVQEMQESLEISSKAIPAAFWAALKEARLLNPDVLVFDEVKL